MKESTIVYDDLARVISDLLAEKDLGKAIVRAARELTHAELSRESGLDDKRV